MSLYDAIEQTYIDKPNGHVWYKDTDGKVDFSIREWYDEDGGPNYCSTGPACVNCETHYCIFCHPEGPHTPCPNTP